MNEPPAADNDAVVLRAPASWRARAGAVALDVVPGTAVLATAVLAALAMPEHGPWWWVCVSIGALAILWTAANRLMLPAITGYSVGRAVFGVCTVRQDRHPRRHGGALVLSAAALCMALAAISYTTVGRYDASLNEARTRIATDGPRMVEQLLSYRPETIQADFGRARTLASDSYRTHLAAQQQAVQKANPVRNEYWVVKSSVLSATPRRITMLVFLDGERGTPPHQRYISASVRASFVDSGASAWHVDRLDVVTAPPADKANP